MSLPKNYIVICTSQLETNLVLNSLDKYKDLPNDYWHFWECVCISFNNEELYNTLLYAKDYFKRKVGSKYVVLTFKEWSELKNETFVLPEKWCIKSNDEIDEQIKAYFIKNNPRNFFYDTKHDYYHSQNTKKSSEKWISCLKKDKEHVEITFEQFKKYVLKKEMEKPTKWCIKQSTSQAVCDWFNRVKNTNTRTASVNGIFKYLCYDSLTKTTDYSDEIPKGYIEINEEQFNELTNPIIKPYSKTMQKLTIPVTDVLEIHKIACKDWKPKLVKYLERTDKDQNITFTQVEVDQMFEAATLNQKPVLEKIFGKKVNLIEWDKIKTGSKVMIKYEGQHCGGKEKIDFNKPVYVVFYKTFYFITSEGKFVKEKVNSPYCTFYQDGNYVLFSSLENTDYITEVIEY